MYAHCLQLHSVHDEMAIICPVYQRQTHRECNKYRNISNEILSPKPASFASFPACLIPAAQNTTLVDFNYAE